MEPSNSDDAPVGVDTSHLERLPPELLHLIFDYILPQGFNFSFSRAESTDYNGPIWTLIAAKGKHTPIALVNRPSYRYWYDGCRSESPDWCNCMGKYFLQGMQTALLYVSKTIASEARAFFFRSNSFSLNISAKAHYPVSLKSPLIFGLLGLPHRLHLLRGLKHIQLTLDVDEFTTFSAVRLRARTQHFVDVIKEHAGNANKQSLLKQLRVQLDTGRVKPEPYSSSSWDMLRIAKSKGCTIDEYYMFALEPLASLQGTLEIEIRGVSAWFKACLETCICGDGGELVTMDWPMKLVKRQQQRGKKKKIEVEVTTRESWQPVFDRREFAARNDILLPDNIDSFLPAPHTEGQEASEGEWGD